MRKEPYYVYLGTNGTIISPVHLEDIYYVRKYSLTAEDGKQLTKDGVHFFESIMVPESELTEWKEV